MALQIENLLNRAQQMVWKYEEDGKVVGILKFVQQRTTRSPKYIVIEQELTSEQLNHINSDRNWWKTYDIKIIKIKSLFNELMKWNQLNGSNQQSKIIKLWDNWKQIINENDVENNKKKQNNNNNNTKNNEIRDLTQFDDNNGQYLNQHELQDIKIEYDKVTQKPEKYLLNSRNIWRLYNVCNHYFQAENNLYQHLEVISTQAISYICGIEWDYNDEKQKKLNNNPVWDSTNQKRKDGTGFSIKYGMKCIFGSGKKKIDSKAMNKDWWKKKALFFTLNDVPVTYDSVVSDKRNAGHHWFSMAVQQYHDSQNQKITNIDWNIFDSFNDSKIINQFRNTHIEPIRCFLDHIYNKLHQWDVTIPEQPKQTMYQQAQTNDNYYDCGIYCCISLNYLFTQFTQKNDSNKNKNHNRKHNIKLREIDEIPMEEGFNAVITLRQLLTNDIKGQYETIIKQMNDNDFPIEVNQYICYRENSTEPLPTTALSWKYFGKVLSIGDNNKNKLNQQLQIIGINNSDNESATEFKCNRIDFIKMYQWRLMNTLEKADYKQKYQKKIEHFFNQQNNNNNNNNNNNIDSTNTQPKQTRKRRRSPALSQPKPATKKQRIDKNEKQNDKKNDNKKKQREEEEE